MFALWKIPVYLETQTQDRFSFCRHPVESYHHDRHYQTHQRQEGRREGQGSLWTNRHRRRGRSRPARHSRVARGGRVSLPRPTSPPDPLHLLSDLSASARHPGLVLWIHGRSSHYPTGEIHNPTNFPNKTRSIVNPFSYGRCALHIPTVASAAFPTCPR